MEETLKVRISLIARLVAAITLTATVAAGIGTVPTDARGNTSQLPGGSNDVTLTPSTIVLGVDASLLITGRGFSDCSGSVNLRLLIDDDWRASQPGALLGAGSGSIDDSGNLEGVIELSDARFPGAWTGYVVMEGACIPEGMRRVFGPVSLAVPIESAETLTGGRIVPPPGAEGAAGFLIPAFFLDRAFVEPNRDGAEPRELVGTLRAMVDGSECASVSVAGTGAGSDVVVYVGMPGQPAACGAADASVVLALGRDVALPLGNDLNARRGVIQSVRPVFLPPAAGEHGGNGAQQVNNEPPAQANGSDVVAGEPGASSSAVWILPMAILLLMGVALEVRRRSRQRRTA